MKPTVLVTLVLSFGLMAGCASVAPPSGPQFTGVEMVPSPDQAVLYIYRTEIEYRQNKDLLLPAVLDSDTVVDLTANAYVAVTVQPGKHVIHSRTEKVDKTVELDVKPGDTLFLRVRYRMRPALCFCSFTEFEVVEEAQAMTQLAGTRQEIERFYAR